MSFTSLVKKPHSAWVWLGAYAFVHGLLWWISTWPAFVSAGIPAWGDWTTPDAAVAAALVVIVVFTFLMHLVRGPFGSFNQRAGSLRSRYDAAKAHHDLSPEAGSGMLASLSIRAALTTFVGVLLLTGKVPDLLDAVPVLPNEEILATPTAALLAAAVLAAALALSTTMGAIVCAEYSLRFDWKDRQEDVQLELRRKADAFNQVGFYALLWSLTAASALVDYRLCFILLFLIYTTMWAYFFGAKDRSTDDGGAGEESPATRLPELAAALVKLQQATAETSAMLTTAGGDLARLKDSLETIAQNAAVATAGTKARSGAGANDAGAS